MNIGNLSSLVDIDQLAGSGPNINPTGDGDFSNILEDLLTKGNKKIPGSKKDRSKDLVNLFLQLLVLKSGPGNLDGDLGQVLSGDIGLDSQIHSGLVANLEDDMDLESIISQLTNLDQGSSLLDQDMAIPMEGFIHILEDLIKDQEASLMEDGGIFLDQDQGLEDLSNLDGASKSQLVKEILDRLIGQDQKVKEADPDPGDRTMKLRPGLNIAWGEGQAIEDDMAKLEVSDLEDRGQEPMDSSQALEDSGPRGEPFLMDTGLLRIENLLRQEVLDGEDIELGRQNLERISDSIIESMEITRQENSNLLEVDLYPRELGSLTIKLELEEGRLTGRILVENEGVRKLVLASIGQLSSNLQREDIRLEEVQVDIRQDLSQSPNQHGQSSNSQDPGQELRQRLANYPRLARKDQAREALIDRLGLVGQGLGGQSLSLLV